MRRKKDLNDALINAVCRGNTAHVCELLDAGADLHANDDLALRWAAYNGHIGCLNVLITAGADLHTCCDEALRHAVCNGHAECVQRLCESGSFNAHNIIRIIHDFMEMKRFDTTLPALLAHVRLQGTASMC